MKYKQKLMPKIIAGIALLALISWIIWTGVLVLANFSKQNAAPELSQEELEKFLETLTWATTTGSWDVEIWTWEITQ